MKPMSSSRFAAAVAVAAILLLGGPIAKGLAANQSGQRSGEANLADEEQHSAAEYWLGVGCVPLPEALRAQITVPKDQGLLVEDLAPDGPAAKGGVRQYDILLTAAGQPLATVDALVAIVSNSAGKRLELKLLRGGKQQAVAVTPEPRPRDSSWAFGHLPRTLETERMLEWLEQAQPGADGRPPVRLRFYHPGTILPPDEPGKADQTGDGIRLTITKQGRNPATIVVDDGSKAWRLQESELDTLPENLRRHVSQALASMQQAGRGTESEYDFTFVPRLGKASDTGSIDKRLDDMAEQIAAMRRSLEQLATQGRSPSDSGRTARPQH